jgi:exodeoxyribonuclease VIII
MKDIMVDLETMDNVPSAAIVAIGAIECNLATGETGSEYYRVVDLGGQEDLGMTLNAETIYWWLQQGDEAREALCISGKLTLGQMCTSFNNWLMSLNTPAEKLRLWGNGASFDNAIIRYAYRQTYRDFVIPFWNDRDMRTIVGFYPPQLQAEWRRGNIRQGAHHNALDDSRHQVKYCSDILSELGVTELY